MAASCAASRSASSRGRAVLELGGACRSPPRARPARCGRPAARAPTWWRGARRWRAFSASQRCFIAPACSAISASSFSRASRRAFDASSLLLAQRLALDLQLDPAALQLVELDRHGVDLHPQPAGRLVDEVDRLVGQEALGDVAVGQGGRGDERRVRDPDAVVDLVALAQAAQDRDRLLDRRLVHEHRLEAPLERGVLLDVLAVLVERGRADGVQLAAGEHRLEQVGGVHRALGRARRRRPCGARR